MKQPQRQSGFTLIEIMVVMVILGLLVAIVAPNIMGRSDEARVTTAKTQLANIENALKLYKLDNGQYPSTEQGLKALVEKPSGYPEPKNWNEGGYLDQVPQDPWGNQFQYISPGLQGPYDLYSYGADGREGGKGLDADLSVHDVEQN
ncbi:type II secretion system major pseudopilin GspG [Marinobacteraceae bacterium S3BR75-40.1]